MCGLSGTTSASFQTDKRFSDYNLQSVEIILYFMSPECVQRLAMFNQRLQNLLAFDCFNLRISMLFNVLAQGFV